MFNNELKGKRLLVLGGSAWLSIIKDFADRNEIAIVTVGNDPTSPLSKAGEYYNINSTDHVAMKQFIQDKHIDGVYMGSNEAVIRHAVQYLAELGLPCYCTLRQWDSLMNKRSFKALCQKFDIPVAHRYEYAPDKPCEVDFPVVAKPADGCASVAVAICNNYNELNKAYEVAYQNSPTNEVLIEKCVNNSGMDVFFQITNGEAEFCALGDKYPVSFAEGAGSVAGARVLPSIYTEEFRSRFEDKLKRLFADIGLYQGLIWMEVFHDGDNYYFNEVGYRPNGSLSIVGIDYLCNINTVAADMHYALTGKGIAYGFPSLILKDAPRGKKKVCEYWVACNPGVVGKIDGIDALAKHPNILAVFPKYDIGDTIPHTNGFAQNFCVIHFAYDDAEELSTVIKYIKETIKVTNVCGRDMIIHKTDNFVNQLIADNMSV